MDFLTQRSAKIAQFTILSIVLVTLLLSHSSSAYGQNSKGHKTTAVYNKPVVQEAINNGTVDSKALNNNVLDNIVLDSNTSAVVNVENANNIEKSTYPSQLEVLTTNYLRSVSHLYKKPHYRAKRHKALGLSKKLSQARNAQAKQNLTNRLIAQQYINTLGHIFRPTLSKNLPDNKNVVTLSQGLTGMIIDKSKALAPDKVKATALGELNKKSNMSAIADGEDLLLLIKIEDIILDAIFAMKSGSGAYIGLESLFSILDFPIEVDPENRNASGWFIREDHTFDITPLIASQNGVVAKVTVDDKTYPVNKSSIRFEADDIYVHSSELFKWLNFNSIINLRDLTLTIVADEKLPLQKRLARESRLGKISVTKIIEPLLPLRDTPYKAFSFPFIDAQLGAFTNSSDREVNGHYSLLGSGDLAYMTADYFVSGNNDDAISNITFALSRDDIDGQLLGPLQATTVKVGDVSPVRHPLINIGTQEVGARIGNRPVGVIANSYDTTEFEGAILPGWDIELYRNEVLIQNQRAGVDGRYSFQNIDLFYGENNFKMLFYGPQGQVQERLEKVPVMVNTALKNNFFYDFSFTKQESKLFPVSNDAFNSAADGYRLSAEFEQGISDNISLSTGINDYDFIDGSHHTMIPLSLNVFALNAKFDLGYVFDIDGGSLFKSNIKTQLGNHAVSLSYDDYINDFKINSDLGVLTDDVQSIKLSGPLFTYDKTRFSYSLSRILSMQLDGNENKFILGNVSANMTSFSLTNSLLYNKFKVQNQGTTTVYNGNLQLTKNFQSFRLRARTYYSIKPEAELTSISSSVLWPITNRLISEVGLSHNAIANAATLNLTWDTDNTSLSTFFFYDDQDNYNVSLNMRFSLGNDPKTNRVHITRNRIANTGGISARVFEDINYDGIYNNDEPLIEGAKINAVNVKRSAITELSGVAFLTGLPKNRITDVEIDIDSLEDPFWVPLNEGFSFMPRPGLVEAFDIPIITSGEIDGFVYIEDEKGSSTVAKYATIKLVDNNNDVVQETVSEYDGFYLFSFIKPGDYSLRISSKFLERRELVQLYENQISILGNGTVIQDESIELVHSGQIKSIVKIQQANSSLAHVSVINLGLYQSKRTAKIIFMALKRKFPQLQPLTIYNDTDHGTGYPLRLNNANNINVTELCKPLISIDLTCFGESINQ